VHQPVRRSMQNLNIEFFWRHACFADFGDSIFCNGGASDLRGFAGIDCHWSELISRGEAYCISYSVAFAPIERRPKSLCGPGRRQIDWMARIEGCNRASDHVIQSTSPPLPNHTVIRLSEILAKHVNATLRPMDCLRELGGAFDWSTHGMAIKPWQNSLPPPPSRPPLAFFER
jgi:hypothetical protein